MKSKLLKFTSTLILLLFALAFLFQKPIRIAVADVIYDNKIHLTACKDLPTFEEAEKVVAENGDFVRQIEEVMPGFIDVSVGRVDGCPGKADILIYFPGHTQREEIEELIGGVQTVKKFVWGIPYRMWNT